MQLGLNFNVCEANTERAQLREYFEFGIEEIKWYFAMKLNTK